MEQKFELLPGAVQVSLGQGDDPEDIVPVFAHAALLAQSEDLRGILVVSGFGDPATAAAVSSGIEQMHAVGAALPFKVAFVAYTLPQYSAYHFAEQYAERFGIVAKLFVSVRDAREWLGVRPGRSEARHDGRMVEAYR